jgi:hypothetical protein
LLRRTLHIRLLEIINPDLELPVPGDPGRQGAMIAAAPVYATRRMATALPSVRVDEVRVSRAVVRVVRDPGGRPTLIVRDCSGTAAPVAANESCSITFAASVEIGAVQFPVAGKFSVAAAGNAVTIEEVTVRQNQYALSLAGVISRLDHPKDAGVQLTLAGDRALLDNLSLLTPVPSSLRIFAQPTLALAITGTPRALRIKSISVR